MRILLIGGNGFIGRFVAAELVQQRHAVAVFHRGTTAALAGVEEVRGDRNQLSASAQELKRFAPDVVIDLVISSGPQAEELMNVFRGATHRVVMLSSIDVYRAVGISQGTESGPLQEVPLTEESELRRSRQDSGRARGDERPRTSRHGAPAAHGVWTRRSAASFLSRREAHRRQTALHHFA